MRLKHLFIPVITVLLAAIVHANPAHNATVNISLEVILNSPLYMDLQYTSVFRIENEDYESSMEGVYNAVIEYNITKQTVNGSELIDADTSNVSVRKYSYSNTGLVQISQPGNYSVCGRISEVFYNGAKLCLNQSINHACKNLTVLDPSTIPCNVTLRPETDKRVYGINESISIINHLSNDTFPFRITYWIEDLFGRMIKQPETTGNLNKKSFKVKTSSRVDAWLVKNRLESIACNNSQNITEKEMLIVVKNNLSLTEQNPLSEDFQSMITIIDPSPNPVKFGDALKLELEIKRGNTRKYSVSIRPGGGRVFEPIKIHVKEKYAKLKTVLPIQIIPNCDKKLKEQEYSVIVEGLGQSAEASFDVEGYVKSLCPDAIKEPAKSSGQDGKRGTVIALEEFSSSYCKNEAINYSIFVENNEVRTINYTAFGYVYRGSKCYSGERTNNTIRLNISSKSRQSITFTNWFYGDSGEYKIKIRVYEGLRKTPYEITFHANLTECEHEFQYALNHAPQINLTEFIKIYDSKSYPSTKKTVHVQERLIYESSSIRSKKAIPGIAILALSLICILLLWKQKLE